MSARHGIVWHEHVEREALLAGTVLTGLGAPRSSRRGARLVLAARSATCTLRRSQPGARCSRGFLELAARAVGLNFRDVLNVLGEYPWRPGMPGSDCAGVVRSGAAGALPVHMVGSAVFGFGNGALASIALAPSALMGAKPSVLSFEEASTLPSTWSTVHEVLRRAALAAGKRLLLHAAAGGVGLAAVEYAQWLEGTVQGSAGRPWKHRSLRERGVCGLLSSRDGEAFAVGSGTGWAALGRTWCSTASHDFTAASFALTGEGGSFKNWQAGRLQLGARGRGRVRCSMRWSH